MTLQLINQTSGQPVVIGVIQYDGQNLKFWGRAQIWYLKHKLDQGAPVDPAAFLRWAAARFNGSYFYATLV